MDRCVEGSCRGAACYAMRRKAHQGVRGVNHPSVALPRIAGVARYTPTEEGEKGNRYVEDYLTKADG